jgi:secondary thiamine-phosphate synthase enzyme
MKMLTTSFTVSSQGRTDILDLTPQVQQVLKKSGMEEGHVLVFVSGSTAGITTIEYEPGLIKDLKAAFQRWAPDNIEYKHHETWGDDNGNSHVRAALLGPSVTVPFKDGKLLLGTWQQIVLIDFDTRARKREIRVQVVGD